MQPEAGGFLVGADDVVHPYHLPRDVHDKPRTPPAERSARGSAEIQLQEDPIEIEEEVPAAGVSFVAADDEYVDMVNEEIAHKQPSAIPKTMRELAEDVEREREASGGSAVEEVIIVPSTPIATATPAPRIPIKPKPKTKSGTSTPASASSSRKKQSAATTSQAVTRTRKRARREASGSEVEDSDVVEIVAAKPAPSKRPRPTPIPAVKSDRVLRARKGKSEDTVREEKEMEAAYRRAVAQ